MEGGLKLYCTTVQFIIMQVGGGVITVVPNNSSVYHYAGWWRGDYSCTVLRFSLSLCRLEGGSQLYCTTVQFIIMQVGGGITVVL